MPPEVDKDAHGVITIHFDVGAKSTLKGKRRRYHRGRSVEIDGLPSTWRDLLSNWITQGERRRWQTLLKDAGGNRVEQAHALLDWLLRNAWTTVIEIRNQGRWVPLWVEFTNV